MPNITPTQVLNHIKNLSKNADTLNYNQIQHYITYLELINKLREIGEYRSAVEYLAGAEKIYSMDGKDFSLFCDALFSDKLSEEMCIALDINTIVLELSDERNYIISPMKTAVGNKAKADYNSTVACVRGQRYQWILEHLLLSDSANVVDLGCAEARLEEHCNLSGYETRYTFNAADRSSYILIQAHYRNRYFKNITFFKNQLPHGNLDEMFKFSQKIPLIVILSEFLEHMPQKDAEYLISNILSKYSPDKMLITMPNYDYTKLYKMDDPNNQVHTFEYREIEFKERLSMIVENIGGYTLEIGGIAGDGKHPQSLVASICKYC